MISQTLKKLRINNEFTQQQIADALSIERSTYAYYELGKTTPDINTIMKLAKIFNVSYTEILETEEMEVRGNLNDSCDDLYYKYDVKNFNHIYELTKKEKTLISLYRILPEDIQNDIVSSVKEKVTGIEKRKEEF